jgi:hypothetical protein
MTESGSKVVEFQRSDESEGFITNTHENIVDLYNKKMAEYAQEFQTQSQGLMSYIQGQLSSVVSWTALPGQLNKIVVSPTGFVWGFNVNGDVYTCKEPCDGANWKYVGPPPSMVGLPLDIVVDDQNVYILYNSQSATKPGCPAGGKGITSVKTSGGYNIRLYTKSECDSIGGNWIGNGARNWGMKTDKVGECYGRPGGNASFCSTDQSPSPEAAAAAGESVSSSASPGVSLAFSLKPVDDSWYPSRQSYDQYYRSVHFRGKPGVLKAVYHRFLGTYFPAGGQPGNCCGKFWKHVCPCGGGERRAEDLPEFWKRSGRMV